MMQVQLKFYVYHKLVISFNPLDFGKLILEIKMENYTQFEKIIIFIIKLNLDSRIYLTNSEFDVTKHDVMEILEKENPEHKD